MATRHRWVNGIYERYESTTGEVVYRSTPVHLQDEFTGAYGSSLDESNGFAASTPGSDDVIEIVTSPGTGSANLITGTAENDTVAIYSNYGFLGSQSPSFQAILYAEAKTVSAIGMGFATSSAATSNAGPLKQVGTTWTTTGTDLVGIHYDASATTGTFWSIATKTNVDATAVNSSVVPVDQTFNILRVDLLNNTTTTPDTVDAYCYIDGVLVGTFSDAVNIATSLRGYIAISCRTATGIQPFGLVDKVDLWSDR